MQKEPQTCVSEMKMIHRMPIVSNAVEPVPEIQWRTRSKPAWCEHLLKNLSVAAALVICAVAVRSGSLENADWSDAVLTAATGDTLLDDQLGKLTFVSSLFPEATLVFGENTEESLPRFPFAAEALSILGARRSHIYLIAALILPCRA